MAPVHHLVASEHVNQLDVRRLLEATRCLKISVVVEKFVSKFAGQPSSGGMALICLAALLMVDAIPAEDASAAVALLLDSQCLQIAQLEEDSLLIACQQVANMWHAAGAHRSVAWLQWLLAQPRANGLGLSDTVLQTTPSNWLDVHAAQPMHLPGIAESIAARQYALQAQPHQMSVESIAPSPLQTTAAQSSRPDYMIHHTEQQATRLRELLRIGSQGRLSPEQAEEAAGLLSDGQLALAAAPSLNHLPALIQHNQHTAATLLAALVSISEAEDYLQVVVGLGATLPALETVGFLVRDAVPLPPDFLRNFVTQCLASCDAKQTSGAATRQVRFVCAFLTMLLREQIGEMLPLLPAVQAFCIEHSRNREAAQLFRRLKELEQDATSGLPDN